ncbi:unnamed protein product [Nesidiocoris tenuis]|uniref:Uncharacterized protein n=1 Tax=Nesidiocoris tenuis TaxID=355587 RepID=A0A6H5GMF1_9HEMI|nr:unnamed protein product [Nesidiocoris tenuis]
MTTPATGERLLKFDRHGTRHSRVHGPRPNCQRRAGLRAALITFGKVFQLGLPANDAPEDGRTAEGTRAIISFESRKTSRTRICVSVCGHLQKWPLLPQFSTFFQIS